MLEKRWFQALLNGVLEAQIVVLHLSHVLHRLLERGRRPHGYVVGMEEIAGLLSAIGESLDGAVTVNLTTNPLYDHRYDVEFDLGGQWSLFKRIRRLVIAPWVMGRLVHATRPSSTSAHRASWCRWSTVAIASSPSCVRRTERSCAISPDRRSGLSLLMNEFGKKLGRDVLTTYEPLVSPGIASEAADRHRRKLAASAERHGQLIFNAPVDQMSYFERPTEPRALLLPGRTDQRGDRISGVT